MAQRFSHTPTLLIFLALVLLRMYALSETGLLDYDSVKNYQVIQEMMHGNFQNLFHHASPAFYLFYAAFGIIHSHFLFLLAINSILNVATALIFQQIFSSWLGHATWEKHLAFLLTGSCVFMVFTARLLSIESLALCLSALAFRAALRFYQTKKSSNWAFIWLYLGLAFTVSYKSLLLAPFFLLLIFCDKQTAWWKKLAIPFFAPAGIAAIWIVIGKITGVDWLTYPKAFYGWALIRDANPTISIPKLQTDVLFYLKYLLHYETFWLLPGALLFGFALWGKGTRGVVVRHKQLLQGIFLCFLALLGFMSLMQKAPRGIMPLFPLVYLFAFEGWRAMIAPSERKVVFAAILILAIVHNLFLLRQHIYQYRPTQYPKVAEWLKTNHVEKLAVSVGIGIIPYLDDEVQVKVMYTEEDWHQLAQKGYTYALVDGYHVAAGIEAFGTMYQVTALASFSEPTLLSPILFLEHCEFANLSYEEALLNRERLRAQDSHLFIIQYKDFRKITLDKR